MAAKSNVLHVPELIADEACEQALVAEAMRSYSRFLARGANPADFTIPAAKLVLEACATLWETAGDVSLTLVGTELQRIGKLAQVGGLRGLAELASVEAIPDHERVRQLASLRRLKESGNEIVRAAHAGDLSRAVEAAQKAEQAALSQGKRKVRPLWEAVDDLLVSMRDEAQAKVARVHPGLTAVYEAIGALPVGSLTVVGADSNVGKSSFALEMLLGASRRNVKCGLISVEDPDEITASRGLAAYSGISSRWIQRGTFTPEDARALDQASGEIRSLGDRFLLSDCTGETELEVCAAMSEMAAKGAKLIVVDYLTEVDASKPQKDRRNEIRWICKRIKAHARRIGVALVVVSQLARPKEGESNKRPSKHHLKESGDVTNMAEVILLLWRSHEDDAAAINVWVAKCKWGGIGQTWTLQRDPRSGRLIENGPASRSA